jgi:hypothetical protein
VEILGPKGPKPYGGVGLLAWAQNELLIADQIMDNPGGGLLFASQTVGQVKAALREANRSRWREAVHLLDEAEDLMVRRQFAPARERLQKVREVLQREPAEAEAEGGREDIRRESPEGEAPRPV